MEEQKKNPAQGLSESEQVQVRRQKLADLQAAGRDPFTLTKFPQDAYSADLKEEFKELPNETDSGKKVALAGRLMSKRVMGKASFAHLRDDKGDIQLYVRRGGRLEALVPRVAQALLRQGQRFAARLNVNVERVDVCRQVVDLVEKR